MHFNAIEWLIFLPLLLLLGWRWPRLGWQRPLRAACLVLWLLILLEPQIRRLGNGLDLWVLVDRSASAAEVLEPRLPEMQSLLERSKSSADRIFYVDYAEVAQVRGDVDEIPPKLRNFTNTALATEYALSRMSPDRASRLLVLTDGNSTEPLTNLGERLIRQQVALDYRLVRLPALADYRVENLSLPARAQPQEPFLIELEVAGDPDATVPFELTRDGEKIGGGEVVVRKGKGAARFTDRLTRPGAYRYAVRLLPTSDAHPGNNVAERWIEITGGPRILLASAYHDDPMARALVAQGFDVECVTDLSTLQPGRLAGAKAVILNNVPAYHLPPDFMAALDFYVRSQSGGLLMVGGKNSFGSGGYFHSAVDDLLPVSMELRMEHRKLMVAIAIVMDRSGSMAANVAGGGAGGGGITKMDLADEGAARSVELLGGLDSVAVFAVDTEAHRVVPLTAVTGDQAQITSVTRRITSGGGGICVPTGLRAAWAELKLSPAGQRHVVLFADANDATQELGDYQKLIGEMRKDGITISVIGLGTDHDSGAKFLQEVAALGGGRIFFNADPAELPALFAQETVAVARSAFLQDPVKLVPSSDWMELAAKPLQWLDAVDGYNLSYLKPNATGAVFSGDEYNAPLVAFWQRGAGRVAAVSFPLGGEFSGRVRDWPHYGDFVQTLGRWLLGEQLPPGIALRTRLDGTDLQLDLLYGRDWEQRFAQAAPRILLVDGAAGKPSAPAWERLEPGHYRAIARLEPERWVRGAVQVGKFVLPFGPLVAGSSLEWSFDRARLEELRTVSRLSGGLERLDLSKIWQAPRRPEFLDLRPWLLILFLVLFVVEALLTRLGVKSVLKSLGFRRHR